MIRIVGDIFEEIKISLNSKFKQVRIEAQVTGTLIIILTVNITIPYLGITASDTQANIISELLPEKYPNSRFGPVKACTGIKIAKIMGGTNSNAKFSLMLITVLRFGAEPTYQTHQKENNFTLHFQINLV
jgi:hypothetical protein